MASSWIGTPPALGWAARLASGHAVLGSSAEEGSDDDHPEVGPALHCGRWPLAVGIQRSAVSSQPSAISRQPSAVSHQPSAVGRWHSAVSVQLPPTAYRPAPDRNRPSAGVCWPYRYVPRRATLTALRGRAFARAGMQGASRNGTWRSPVAHFLGVEGVAGSNPVVPMVLESGLSAWSGGAFLFAPPVIA